MNNSGIDINILEAYLKGTLDPKAMHRVEKEALEDPFVAEALEGLSQSAAYAQNLSLLQRQLHERVAEQKVAKKANVITWQRLSIAAAAAVVFISVGIMFLMRGTNSSKQTTASNKAVEVSITPLDSVQSDSVPVLAAVPASEEQIAKAKAVAAAPVKAVVVPEKVEQEVSTAISDVTPSAALARNTVRPQTKEEIVLSSTLARKEQDKIQAMAATPLQSRVSDISIPAVQGKFVSPKDGTTPVPDPVVKPVLGNMPETLAYAQDVKASPNHSLVAGLRDNNNALNEVAVRGYNTFALAKSVPLPSVDNAAYTEYLNKNNKLRNSDAVGEYVELSFTVSKSGKPANIKVQKGLERKYNNEAIRLLTDGPKWIAPKKGSNKATLKVYF